MKMMTSCAAILAVMALGAPALAQPAKSTSPAAAGETAQPAMPQTGDQSDVSATQPVPSTSMAPPATATQPSTSMTPSTAVTQPATQAAPSATASGADASVTTGMSVKDNTGAAIGSVSEVKADASGAKVATIKMGAETFAVDTTSLAVRDGAAVINATQAEIKDMMAKK